MEERQVMYGVRLVGGDGEPYFALGGCNAPAVFFRRRDAIKFRNELAPYIDQRGKVVKVELVIRQIEP